MDVSETIKGNVYISLAYGNIFMSNGNGKSSYYLGNNCTIFKKGDGYFKDQCVDAGPENTFWMKECIRLNEFIEFKDLDFSKIEDIQYEIY